MSQYFRPNWCDDYGSAFFPFVIKGTLNANTGIVTVEEPAEVVTKWPSISIQYLTECKPCLPRRLTADEVLKMVRG